MTNLEIGDLRFEVRHSDRRRTLQITVDRDGELILSMPSDCPAAEMEAFVRQKRFWIYTKLAEKEALTPVSPAKEYRSGEGFSYLGRSYRLLLVARQDVPVKLTGGRFCMRRDCAADGRKHLVAWYTQHAGPWIEKRIDLWSTRVGVKPTSVSVEDLGYRWGSCGKSGTLHFHWKTMMLPARMVEYVIAHELVHLHEAHHTPDFWLRLERAMPDFAARKQWLAENGAKLAAI